MALENSKTLHPTHESGLDQSNTEKRLRNSSNQFMQLADKLLGAMKSEEDEIQHALGEAKNYNLVSQSVKTLPKVGKTVGGIPRQPTKFGKLVGVDESDPVGDR